ncbi:MAG: sodium/solute symporter [Bacteroidota bacterium]
MSYSLGAIDTIIIGVYAMILIVMGWYFFRRSKTSEHFMVAGQSIPAWAAGIAVMSTYTSSISYIAVPGKAFDSNWHPLIFALSAIPVTWFVTAVVIPHYRKNNIISVYNYLEEKIGGWARAYAAISFVLYMIGRTAVILYLSSLLLSAFLDVDIQNVIILIGIVTIIYTLMGGMEAVIWTDVMQSVIMVGGILFVVAILSYDVFSGTDSVIQQAYYGGKFSFGDSTFSLSNRTIWVMIIYGVTENIRNLIADQNYTQKYSSVGSEKEAKKSVWVAMLIYLPLTAIFLFVGTALFAFYSDGVHQLGAEITKGDQVFPYFIATELPVGLKGLIIAAIIAASMSTVDSALNSSATVLYVDFYKKFFKGDLSERRSLVFLRSVTVIWGIFGIAFAVTLINAKSALDVWWEISGIFGGGILGLFLLALFNAKLTFTQGITSVLFSIMVIIWATFMHNLSPEYTWLESDFDPILIGAVATGAMILIALIFVVYNKYKTLIEGEKQEIFTTK